MGMPVGLSGYAAVQWRKAFGERRVSVRSARQHAPLVDWHGLARETFTPEAFQAWLFATGDARVARLNLLLAGEVEAAYELSRLEATAFVRLWGRAGTRRLGLAG